MPLDDDGNWVPFGGSNLKPGGHSHACVCGKFSAWTSPLPTAPDGTSSWTWTTRTGGHAGIVCPDAKWVSPCCMACQPKLTYGLRYLGYGPLHKAIEASWGFPYTHGRHCSALAEQLERGLRLGLCGVCKEAVIDEAGPGKRNPPCAVCESVREPRLKKCVWCKSGKILETRLGQPMCGECQKIVPCGCNRCRNIPTKSGQVFWRSAAIAEIQGVPNLAPFGGGH